MHPILFRLPEFIPWIGGAPVRSFGVMVALGFLAGLYFTLWQAKRHQIKPELIQDLVNHVQGAGVWLDTGQGNREKAIQIAAGRRFESTSLAADGPSPRAVGPWHRSQPSSL